MEIHITSADKLVIFAKTIDGEVKTLSISYAEMMGRGELLIDGLTKSEIKQLETGRRIVAIKLHRARTGMGLKDSKTATEDWAEKNRCCRRWPICEHVKALEGLDLSNLKYEIQGLMMTWTYPGHIYLETCKTLMMNAGYSSEDVGVYSVRSEGGNTVWNSNNKES